MAKRRRRRSRRRRLGSVIQVKRLSGVGQLRNPNSMSGALLPVLIGGGVTVATALGIRQFLKPTTETQQTLHTNAAWLGVGAGVLSGLVLWNTASQPAGVAALVSSAVVGAAMVGLEAMAAGPTAGLGAIVAEYGRGPRQFSGGGRHNTGVIVFEPTAARGYGAPPGLGWTPRGEEVNLAGINVNAFGTPMFTG